MTVKQEFVSVANKGLLWNVLFESKAFAGLPPSSYDDVQRTFEQTVASEAESISGSAALVDANKDLIAAMVKKMDAFKTKDTRPPVGSIELFDAKKAELEDAMTVKAPEGVSFADETDEPLDEAKLDSLLESTIKQRKADMASAGHGSDALPKKNKKVAWADEQPTADSSLPAALAMKLKPAPGQAPKPDLSERVSALEARVDGLAAELRTALSRQG